MMRLRVFFSKSILNKFLLLFPAVTFLFWFLTSIFYLAFVAKEGYLAFSIAGMTSSQVGSFFSRHAIGFIVIVLTSLAAQMILSAVIAENVSRPLRRLAERMRGIQPTLGTVPELLEEKEDQVDEAAQLTRSINQFIETIAKYEDKLKQQAHLAAIGETAGMVAHDVRKPLAAMRALMRVLPQRRDDVRFLAEAQGHVECAIAQAEGLLADILEFSKEPVLAREAVDPQSMITAAVGEVLRRHPVVTVRFEYDLKHTCGIDGDRARLLRVVGNIVENAVQAMGGVGTITFTTEEVAKGGEVDSPLLRLAIANDGPAIPVEVLPRLFDPFFTKGKKNGTGLGLAICKRMVEAHGGTIDVTSVSGATTFRLDLPGCLLARRALASELIREAREVTQYASVPVTGPVVTSAVRDRFLEAHGIRGETRLLLVDDEPLFREMVRSQLYGVGEAASALRVVEAGSVVEALAVMEAQSFTHLLTDLVLGPDGPDGYVLCHEVLTRYPNVRVTIHSNKRQAAQDEALKGRAGFLGWLPKPATTEELLLCLADVPCGQGAGLSADAMTQTGVARPVEGKRLLLLNDDPGLRQLLKMMLGAITPTLAVREAGTVAEALTCLARERIDLIVSDINLGEDQADGYNFLHEVRTHHNGVPFFFCSGNGARKESPRALAAGATGYLQLPLEEAHLATLRAALALSDPIA